MEMVNIVLTSRKKQNMEDVNIFYTRHFLEEGQSNLVIAYFPSFLRNNVRYEFTSGRRSIFVYRYPDNQPTVFPINTEILFRLVAFAVALSNCNAMS